MFDGMHECNKKASYYHAQNSHVNPCRFWIFEEVKRMWMWEGKKNLQLINKNFLNICMQWICDFFCCIVMLCFIFYYSKVNAMPCTKHTIITNAVCWVMGPSCSYEITKKVISREDLMIASISTCILYKM